MQKLAEQIIRTSFHFVCTYSTDLSSVSSDFHMPRRRVGGEGPEGFEEEVMCSLPSQEDRASDTWREGRCVSLRNVGVNHPQKTLLTISEVGDDGGTVSPENEHLASSTASSNCNMEHVRLPSTALTSNRLRKP